MVSGFLAINVFWFFRIKALSELLLKYFFLSLPWTLPMEIPWLDGGPFQFFPAGGRRFRIAVRRRVDFRTGILRPGLAPDKPGRNGPQSIHQFGSVSLVAVKTTHPLFGCVSFQDHDMPELFLGKVAAQIIHHGSFGKGRQRRARRNIFLNPRQRSCAGRHLEIALGARWCVLSFAVQCNFRSV